MSAADTEGPDIAAAGSVANHMSRKFLAVRGDCSLGVAMDTVLASGHRHVVVVDSQGSFEGVLPAEVITASWMTRLAHRRQLMRDLIIEPHAYVSPDASMHTAASVMLSHCVDAVGVVETDGRLVGVLTWADIVAMVAERERA